MCWTSCVSGDTGGGAVNSRSGRRSSQENIFVKRVFNIINMRDIPVTVHIEIPFRRL